MMISQEFYDYYNAGKEIDRNERCKIEFIRTKEILMRHTEGKIYNVLDMGGGAGYYSFWLAMQGHKVHLKDIVELHIEQAKEYEQNSGIKLASIEVGDAINISAPDKSFDIVLLLGPLYHIQSQELRIKVLKEAKRVLKDHGKIFAACIPRTATIIDGYYLNSFESENYFDSAIKGYNTGIHNDNIGGKFTNAFFHSPNEIRSEIESANLKCEELINIEGVMKIICNFNEKITDIRYLDFYLNIARLIENEESLMGIANHILAVISNTSNGSENYEE